MARIIVCYSLGKIAPALILKFNHQLYRFTDRSDSRRYIYEREGILQKNRYEKPSKGLLIMQENDRKKVEEHLKNMVRNTSSTEL